jgi:hypothetical protein
MIYTDKEFKKIKKQKSKEDSSKKELSSPLIEESKRIPPVPVFEYKLMFPENGSDELVTFHDTLTIDGKEYTRDCVRAILKTKEDVLAKYLLSIGWILLDKVKQ